MKLTGNFTIKGRISRMNYLKYQVIVGIPILVLHHVYRYGTFFKDKTLLALILFVLFIPLHIILICKTIQRLHDLNTPEAIIWGLTIFISLIYLLNTISSSYDFLTALFLIYLALLLGKGAEDANEYGEVPIE